MKVRLNKTTWRAASGIVASFILVVSFQNCGKAGFDSELDSTLSAGTSDAALSAKYGTTTASKVSSIPFAYDAGFDTITYNSCAETHLRNNKAFTSLQAGAFTTGGIKIKDEFFDYADQNFKPVYPATSLSLNQYKEFLQDSPANAGAVPTVGIRVKNSLTDVYTTNSQVTLWSDIIPMVGTLTDALVMDSFLTANQNNEVQKGVTANYFPFSPEQRVMDSGISFNASEELAEEFRNIFMSAGILALTYMPTNAEEVYKVRSPSSAYPVKTAYGKGYSLTFTPLPGTNASTNPNRTLAQVIETDLASPGVGAKNWNCNRKYAVIRSQDAASLCPALTYAQMKDANVRTELSIMRRHLRADQWDVNPLRGCVVPKNGISCYKEENLAAKGFAEVEYDLSKECFRPNGSYGGATPTSKCLHFVTVCTRD
ncbi:hypothetical protein [uncultured Bdellovibrio sp.]|uniref:hypothetical protein n=1 Tax=Bdellovibrio sp. HCB-162 TaxID=3394234 RepID=UPI0025E7BDA2|nr:hypothetical protein [uncultured Bdellovibrio sp.]